MWTQKLECDQLNLVHETKTKNATHRSITWLAKPSVQFLSVMPAAKQQQ